MNRFFMENAFDVLMGLLVLIAIFLVFRVLILWYWKIDRAVEAIEGIRQELSSLRGLLTERLTTHGEKAADQSKK